MPIRFDTGSLGKLERTPQGGIRVPAGVTRSGLLTYVNPDGSKRVEYRPQDEVERADSLATLRDAPVTNLHHGLVDASNYRKVTVGTASGTPRMDGVQVVTDLVIQDGLTIDQIDKGERREVSSGYTCQIDPTPGMFEGERYDVIQKNIRYNHIALVPKGRAGSEVALRLDAEDNQIREDEDVMKKIEIIGGVEYEVGTDAHAAARKVREDAEAAVSARLNALTSLEAENAELKAQVERFESAAQAAARKALEAAAVKIAVEVRADMSDADIRRAVISKAHPDLDLEGKPAAYLDAAYDLALASLEAGAAGTATKVRADALDAKRGGADHEDAAPDEDPSEVARREMIKRQNATFIPQQGR